MTGTDGKNYNVIHYNLDMIISLGYRIKSKIATNFRRWAAERLKEAMIKANAEYQKYQINNLSPVEEEYLLTIKNVEKKAKSCQ